jgi:hypothetical protein
MSAPTKLTKLKLTRTVGRAMGTARQRENNKRQTIIHLMLALTYHAESLKAWKGKDSAPSLGITFLGGYKHDYSVRDITPTSARIDVIYTTGYGWTYREELVMSYVATWINA